ncbi:glycosyltransferase family protein [Alkalibacillus silvisoli]|uniref:NTP transferase domain-containing protein n=1 Tax=Alkalibacillus silvisoli TaxID=392823 RepID=A0ABP3JKD7_9BACI
MKIVAIIQARMGSTRLPGKVLKPVLGKPLLAYQLKQMKRAKLIDTMVVATTDLLEDDAIVTFCNEYNMDYFRGSETDVLSRYYEAANTFQADAIVRLTSDCPLIDPTVVDSIIGHFLTNKTYDYVSNTIDRTYPRGMDVEIFTIKALRLAYIHAKAMREREHVTPYMINKSNQFNIDQVVRSEDQSHLRLTVDTAEDFELIKRIIHVLAAEKSHFTLNDVVGVLNENPHWLLINSHIEQKKE